jgi:cyanophycinase
VGVPGPVALVGSGEFLEPMRAIDERLLEGRPRRAVILPTAAAEEGEDRVRYWTDLGSHYYEGMDVRPVPLRVLSREDAENPRAAAAIAGAGIVYLSGGDPGYLADTLRDTLVWDAILDAWGAGAALAGCSAGACALTAVAHRVRNGMSRPGRGLAVVPELTILPHFDRIEAWVPGVINRVRDDAPPGTIVVGIDEETALVGGPVRFEVQGRRSVWQIDRDGTRHEFPTGATVDLLSAGPTHGHPALAADPAGAG